MKNWMGFQKLFNVPQDELVKLHEDSLKVAPRDWKLRDGSSIHDAANGQPYSVHFQKGLWALLKYWRAKQAGPVTMVETGMSSGVSTAYILQALREEDTLYTIDCSFLNTVAMCDQLLTLGFAPSQAHWIPVCATSQAALPQIFSEHNEIDVFLHDSDHGFECQDFEYRLAHKHLRSGGLLMSDDWTWGNHGAWQKFVRDVGGSYVTVDSMSVLKKE